MFDLAPDAFSFHTRIVPMIITLAPVMLLVIGLYPPDSFGQGVVISLLFNGALGGLLAQTGRDFGEKKKRKLWENYDGQHPSTVLLRWRDDRLEPERKAVLHNQLARIVEGFPENTLEIESKDPAAADVLYRRAGACLKEITREGEAFALVKAENINYGMRRNLWGLKPLGITICVITLVLCGAIWYFPLFISIRGAAPTLITTATLAFLLLVLWWRVVTPNWARMPGEAYARRLLGAVDILSIYAPPVNRE